MNLNITLLLVVFFGIFHVFGGALFGRGIRARREHSGDARPFLVGGAVFGIAPVIFDFAFFIPQGAIVWGLIGPALFVLAALISAFVWEGPFEEIDTRALISLGMGSGAVLLGVFGALFMWNAAQTSNPGLVDYIMGGVWTCMFVGIGGSFAWAGLSAILHHRTLDEENKFRERAAKRRKPKKKSES
ncbi:MAG: hypothetical protein HY741_05870 [Chloroflexi bacterium]|nr:hypothetical protein [Chloroflexota bacterium]